MRLVTLAAVASLSLLAAGCAQTGGGEASSYPDGTIKVLVPFAPGSSTDVVARIWADCHERVMKTPFTVENRDGGSGALGMTEASRAKADGYTIVQGSTSSVVLTPYFTEEVSYGVDDFTPVGAVALTPAFIVVAKDSPIKSVDDLVAAGQKKTLAVSDSGESTISGLISEALVKNHGIKVKHVTPSSTAETKRGLEQGDYDYGVVAAASETIPWVTDGSLRALAVAADESPSWAPELPTLDSLGYGDGQLPGPGIMAFWAVPDGAPAEIVDKLEEANATCTKDEKIVETLGVGVVPPEPFSSEEVQGFLSDSATALQGLDLK